MQSIDQEGKTVEEALEKALVSLERTADEVNYEVLDEGSKGVLGVGARPILLRVRVKDIPEVSNAKNVLSKFLTELEVNFSSLEVTLGVDNIIKTSFDVPEEDIGIFIGKRGQTLDSLQYIVNQIMHESKFKFNIDISKYREKQHEKLRETIRKIAGSVEHTGRRVTLKPMSAFDRRIVHETVKEFTELVTKSIGLEPRRRVVISLVNDIVSEDDREYSPRYVDENVSNEGYKGGYNSRPNYNNNRSDSRPNYNNNRPDSRPSYNNNRPDSRPSYNNNRPDSRPSYDNNRPDSRPSYNNNRPDSRPSYDNNRPDSRPSYNNNRPDSRPSYDNNRPDSRPSYNNNRPDSRPAYNNNRPDSRPSYDNNRPDSRPSYNNNRPDSRPSYDNNNRSDSPRPNYDRPIAYRNQESRGGYQGNNYQPRTGNPGYQRNDQPYRKAEPGFQERDFNNKSEPEQV